MATGELASGVQEIDATARVLREQAERLDELVARFIIEGEVAPDPTRPGACASPTSSRRSPSS